MKYVGKSGLKVNGKEVWHEGNFNPSSKSDTGHAHTIDSTIGNLPTNRLTEPAYVTGSITRTARPLFDVLRADRTAFLPATQIIIEKSTDAGATWTDAGVSDTTKRRLFTGQRPSIAIPLKNGIKSTDCMIRVTITGMRYNVPDGTAETAKYNYWNSSYVSSRERYFAAQEGWVWINSNSDRIYLKIERATGANPTSWITDREAYMSGWAGGNYFSLSGSAFGGRTTQTGNYWNWRFTFRTCSTKYTFNDADLSSNYPTSAQSIYHIKICGQNVWIYSNNYMYHDHLYNWDEDKNATFPAEIKATTFKSNGGIEVAYKNEIPTSLPANGGNAATVNGKTVEANVPANAKFTDTVYTHPANHPASIITQDANNRFVTDAEKSTWNAKQNALSGDVSGHYHSADRAWSNITGKPSTFTPTAHTHTKSQITDMPTKLSQFENDIGAGTGINIVVSATEPAGLNPGDWWCKEV